MVIRCPHCQFSRSITLDKIPATAEVATCPKCKRRFRFRTLPKRPQPEYHIPAYEEETPPSAESRKTQRTETLPFDTPPAQKNQEKAPPKKDIWDALSSLGKLWEKEKKEEIPAGKGQEEYSHSVDVPFLTEDADPSSAHDDITTATIDGLPNEALLQEKSATNTPPVEAVVENTIHSERLPLPDDEVEVHILDVDGRPTSFRNPWVKKETPTQEPLTETTSPQGSTTTPRHTPETEKKRPPISHTMTSVPDETATVSEKTPVAPSEVFDNQSSINLEKPAHLEAATSASLQAPATVKSSSTEPTRALTPLESLMAQDTDELVEQEDSAPSLPAPDECMDNAATIDSQTTAGLSTDDAMAPAPPADEGQALNETSPLGAEPSLLAGAAEEETQATVTAASPSDEVQAPLAPDVNAMHPANAPFDYADTTPEERVEKDIHLLQTEITRPTRDLGVLREVQPESILYPFTETREIPWEHPTTYGVVSSLIRTIKSVMFSAPAFFRTMPPSGGMTFAFLFFILHGYIAVICTTAWVALAALLFDIPALAHIKDFIPAIALFTPVGLSLLLIAATSCTRIFLIVFQRQQATFAFTFKLLAYAIAPLLLSIVPFIGPIAGLIWSFIILATACHHGTGLSPTRSVITITPAVLLTLGAIYLAL